MRVRCGYLNGLNSVSVRDRELELSDDEVLVQTYQSSICDADLYAFRTGGVPADLPSFEWLGHEGGGTVVETGRRVQNYKPGDRVMLFGPNGSFSNYFKAPERNLHRAPDGLALDVASLAEPTCVGMFGVFQAGVQPGDTVVVAGLNFQGLIGVQGLRRKGAAKVIAVDYSEAHLQMARDLGADVTINSTKVDPREAILGLTGGNGADVVYHSCGYWNPRMEEYFNISVDVTRDDGILVSVPDMMNPLNTSLHRIHHHGIDLRIVALMHHGPHFLHQWVPRLMRPITQGIINIPALITGSYIVEQMPAAMQEFHANPDHVKIVLKP